VSITSPSGIDYRPAPPKAVRLRRAIAIGAVTVAVAIVGIILYGIESHGVAAGGTNGKAPAVQPASAAAQKIVSQQAGKPRAAVPMGGQALQPLQPASTPPALGAPARQPIQYAQLQPQPVATYQQPPQPTPEEKAAAAAFDAEQRAIASPASPSGWKSEQVQASPGPTKPPSDQDSKELFLDVAKRIPGGRTSVSGMRVASVSPYEIKAGWLLPAILETQINSDLPGETTALLRENVYDTATGKYLLIPQGSRLFGAYDSHISYGQGRVQVVWYRIIFPDASSLSLEGMSGHNTEGSAGFNDKVDNHYKRLITTALLTSAFFAGGALAQTRRGSVLGYPSAQEVASTAAANNMSQEMIEITRRNLNIQPTITIRHGYAFNVICDKDIVFEGPYRALPPLMR
jgi:type IV secretory pathway VirB10-like protein